jgi:alpha-D-xyloside xylohydrolase
MNEPAPNSKTVSKINMRTSLSSVRRLAATAVCSTIVATSLFATDAYQLTSTTKDVHGVTFKLSKGALRVEVCTPTIIHVVVSPSSSFPDQLVPVVTHHWTPVPFKYQDTGGNALIDTGKMQATIARGTGAITFAGHDGRTILSEVGEGGRTLEPVKILGEEEWKAGQTFVATDDEALYGLGQRQENLLDIKGTPIRLQQANTNIAVPFLLSTKGYGLLWNNASLTDFNPAAEEIQVDPKTGEGTFRSGVAGAYGFLIVSDLHDRLKIDVNDTPVVNLENMWVPKSAGGKIQLPANTLCKIKGAGGPSGVHVYMRKPSATTEFLSAAAHAIDYYLFYGPDLNRVVAEYREATGAVRRKFCKSRMSFELAAFRWTLWFRTGAIGVSTAGTPCNSMKITHSRPR